MSDSKITVTEDGPYVVTGGVQLDQQIIGTDEEGQSVRWVQGKRYADTDAGEYKLCRCGQSANKPFCDDSHERLGFDGTETATHLPYLAQAGEEDGPEITLTDAPRLCAFARFCDADGSVWNLTMEPGRGGRAREEAEMCPSGRLVAWDLPSRTPYEPELPPSIGVVEDPGEGVSGPLWVRGGIQVESADGTTYQVRNRVTLCRCGASENKPFCDGSHAAIGFDDGAFSSGAVPAQREHAPERVESSADLTD